MLDTALFTHRVGDALDRNYLLKRVRVCWMGRAKRVEVKRAPAFKRAERSMKKYCKYGETRLQFVTVKFAQSLEAG